MHRDSRGSRWVGFVALALGLAVGRASSASVYGPLDNFDVVNDTGQSTCGFEIEIDGVHAADVYRTFDAPYIRYSTPTVTDTATGVLIHYQGAWDPVSHTFLQTTPPAAPGYVPLSDSCWTGGLGAAYEASGCEHFGVSQTTQATATRYHWLSCNPDGTTSPLPDIGLPTPAWTVSPPALPADPPVVQAAIEIPNPNGDAYGDPYWVKIYKTEIERPAVLEDLLMENADVANAPTEIEWELLQAKPGQSLVINEAPLPPGAEAVIRRYEFYHYNTDWGLVNTYIDPNTGLPVTYVDPDNGEVMECVVNGCNDPTPDELGSYIGRQVAGFNVPPPACGNGADDDGDGAIDYPDDPDCSSPTDPLEAPDADFDDVADDADDCVSVANASQVDSDLDGYGNACDADYDGNGAVGNSDFTTLRRAFGSTVGSPRWDPRLDADDDGAIGIVEWMLFRASYAEPPGPSGLGCAGTVPCPNP